MIRSSHLRDLIHGRMRTIRVGQPSDDSDEHTPRALFPGAFDPLHEGHREIARIAESRLRCAPQFELSVTNVDKAALEELEIKSRLSQFAKHNVVWLTRTPTFVEKAQMFPGATFVVGADTIHRICDPRYYDNSQEEMNSAIREIAHFGCRFLVFGRILEESFRTLSELRIDDLLKSICTEVAEAEFRVEISSTELRGSR
jgi:hypothetical protein